MAPKKDSNTEKKFQWFEVTDRKSANQNNNFPIEQVKNKKRPVRNKIILKTGNFFNS